MSFDHHLYILIGLILLVRFDFSVFGSIMFMPLKKTSAQAKKLQKKLMKFQFFL